MPRSAATQFKPYGLVDAPARRWSRIVLLCVVLPAFFGCEKSPPSPAGGSVAATLSDDVNDSRRSKLALTGLTLMVPEAWTPMPAGEGAVRQAQTWH